MQKPHLCSGQLSHPFNYYINIVIQNIQHNYRSQQKVKILEYLTLTLLNLNLSLKKHRFLHFHREKTVYAKFCTSCSN